MMNNLSKYISAAFLPERCPYCGDTVPADKPACRDCIQLFPETITECYAKGGYPCAAPFIYEGIFSDAVKSFKFFGKVDNAAKLAEEISSSVKEAYTDVVFSYITYVPMHAVEEKERGYNQSELLAEELSKQLEVPYTALLIKHRENEPQHSLSGRQKRENVKGVYKALNPDTIKGNIILIIDDIITSGYTLGECCRVLEKAGAEKIYCAAVCAKNIS